MTLSWYFPFIPEETENVVIQPTESLTTQIFVEIKFNEIVDHLKAEYPDANYRLLYFPDTLLPCCYIHSRHEKLKAIQESIDNYQASLYFTVIIDSQCGGYCGYNPEFESLTSDIWDSMSFEGLMLDTLYGAIQQMNIQSSSEVNVMFGPTYDYNIKQWTSRASIWIGYTDPIMRQFLLTRDESRVEECYVNSTTFPVQYWSMTSLLLTRYSDTEDTLRHKWESEIGIKCNVSDGHIRKGSLGPSIKSMFPDWNVPETWFLTAAHNFEYPKQSGNHSFALQHHKVQNLSGTDIGELIGVRHDLKLAVVEIDSKSNNCYSIKITDQLYIPCTHALEISESDEIPWNEYIYKSGATSGLTSGMLSSWGVTLNPNVKEGWGGWYMDQMWANVSSFFAPHPYIVVRKNKGSFSEKGDSGSSVFFINDQMTESTVIGILEGVLEPHISWPLSVVTPFSLEKLKKWTEELNSIRLNFTVINDITNIDLSSYIDEDTDMDCRIDEIEDQAENIGDLLGKRKGYKK